VVKNRKDYISVIIPINTILGWSGCAMKQVFTISLDEELAAKIREKTRTLHFRNKSHLVEEAIIEFLGEKR